jgi:hypothetical protein
MEDIHIFTKIYELMGHFENLCHESVPSEKKYKEDDEFFAFIFQNVKEVDPQKQPEKQPEKEETNPTSSTTIKEEESESNEQSQTNSNLNNEPASASTKLQEESDESIVNKYIKKCYKKIVLKCHPDKNKKSQGASTIFVRCQEYYDNRLLIGILYIFYLYSIKPPEPLNALDPNNINNKTNALLNRIAKEIYIIQKKIVALSK